MPVVLARWALEAEAQGLGAEAQAQGLGAEAQASAAAQVVPGTALAHPSISAL